MNDQRLAKRSRHSGRHWLFTAMAIPLSPLMFGVAVQQNQAWHACVARHSLPVAPTQGPCAANYFWLGLTMLVFYVLAFAATITGLAIGVVEGRRRRRFAHGRWTSMSVVGLCAPWALLAYALGYGLGRLLPAPRSSLIEQTRLGGWQQAVQLYA